MSKQKRVNGVNVEDLVSTLDAIKEQPEIAKFKFRATNKWLNGGHNRTTLKDFYGATETQVRGQAIILDADEPPVLLGEDQGPNSVEYALTALAACLTTTIVYHAAARGIEIDEIESTVEGDLDLHGFLNLDENVRNGYEGVRISFNIKADASEEELAKILQLGPTFSPVFDIFTNRVPVTVELAKEKRVLEKRAA
jgi:uncharacterized OsmC-like protein